jgi:hypothetical protein
MTGRCEHQPFAKTAPEALAVLRAQVTALLRFQDLLPVDLYVKLDLLHGDVSAAIAQGAGVPAARRSPSFVPHAAASHAAAPHQRLPGGRRQLPSPDHSHRKPPMTSQHPCACGYEAASADDLADHLAEAFTPDDDRAPDGQVHAEAASDAARGDAARTDAASAPRALACLCGYPATSIAGLDAHLLAAFTPADHTGRDGARHEPAPASSP